MFLRKLCAISAVALVAGCTQTVENPAQSPSYVAATLGYDAYKQGDLQGAETQFETALSAEPDNPYALLGLGAVREKAGDYADAERLYTAARSVGHDAQANYTYITEQRLEKATNRDVASLAEENLTRLSVKRASLQEQPVLAETGFASYDGGVAVVTDEAMVAEVFEEDVPALGVIAGESYGIASIQRLPTIEPSALPPVEFQPIDSYAREVVASNDLQPIQGYDDGYTVASDGNYQQVGSYEDYAANLGGVVEPAYAEAVAAPLPSYETIPSAVYDPFEPAIQPASYGVVLDAVSPVIEPAVYNGDASPYDMPLSYGDTVMAGPVSADFASVTPTYAPVSQLQAPVAAGPSGGVLAYGQSLGGPVDLVAATRPARPLRKAGSAEVNVTNTGGLIFLDDS